MTALRAAVADLVLGARCPVCGSAGFGVCRACARTFEALPRDVPLTGLGAVGLNRVVASARHEGQVREALLSWKLGGAVGFDPLMAVFLAASVIDLVGDVDTIDLVPIPSSRRSRRERGRDLVTELARRTARMLSPVGLDARVVPSLRWARQPGDQHALGRVERRLNLDEALTLRRRPTRPVVVVDDIVTTGSTLAEAARALSSDAHITLLGAAAVAVAEKLP